MAIEGNPAKHCAAVTPSDTADLANYARALYVGTGGDVTVDTLGERGQWETNVTIPGVPSGFVLPVSVRRVRSTGTTASGIVAFW